MNRKEEFYNNIVVLDTEATSRDPFDAEVIEFAARFTGVGVNVSELYTTADGNIPYEVQAVTHITPRMIEGKKLFKTEAEKTNELLNSVGVVVAQNIWYDENLLKKYNVTHPNWLCTLRLAKRLFNDDESFTQFNLSYLRYRLHVELPEDTPTHRALADVLVTVGVLEKLVEEMESRGLLEDDHPWADQILDFIDQPITVHTMPFGKHKGLPLSEVPMSYWNWALVNIDSLDENSTNYDNDFANSVANVIETQL